MRPHLPKNLTGLEGAITVLLANGGLYGDANFRPIPLGANNQVFEIECKGSSALLKVYFRHQDDPRDRLGTEFKFYTFAWDQGIRSLPKPLACDPLHSLGLYEFVKGRRLLAQEITGDQVRQALKFYQGLNLLKFTAEAQALPVASEACFAIAEHFECVDQRLDQLMKIDDSHDSHQEAAHFVRNDLLESWSQVKATAIKQSEVLGLSLDTTITQYERCLSPSDFGFHNAIIGDDGNLYFIDFEYAGWDDPAKLVCDFFCQPSLPVDLSYYDLFAETVVADLPNPEIHLQRFALLMPVYQLKWCCVFLNDFLLVSDERRRFAYNGIEGGERKLCQLEKARQALQRIL